MSYSFTMNINPDGISIEPGADMTDDELTDEWADNRWLPFEPDDEEEDDDRVCED